MAVLALADGCAREGRQLDLALDLAAFGVPCATFPSKATGAKGAADASSIRRRLELAQSLASGGAQAPRCIAGSLLAFLQPLPRLARLSKDYNYRASCRDIDELLYIL